MAYSLQAVVAATMLVGASCNDPKSVERQNRRYQRIAATLDDVRAREERRPRQIQRLADTSKRQEEERAVRLRNTLRRISDRFDRDVHYLQHGDPVQSARIERLWNGHPENIPNVWSRLVF